MKNKITLIAEAGVNHNGSIKIAKKLVDIAKEANSSFVKFQTFKAENLVTINGPKAKYQKTSSKNKETQFEMLKKLELNYNDHINLIDHCNKKKINFLSTPFDEDSFLLLKNLEQKVYKISSSDLNNYPFLEFISKNSSTNFQVILSTGMSSINEVKKAVKYLTKYKIRLKNISILHCTSNYPASLASLNLYSIKYLKKIFKHNEIGYSDHTIDDLASILAVGLGARIIEKHFTIKQNMLGPDHKASLPEKNFINFAKKILGLPVALGIKNQKKPSKDEIEMLKIARKSIFAKLSIKKGEKFTHSNLTLKRPNSGLQPENYFKLIGKISKKNYKKDEQIKK